MFPINNVTYLSSRFACVVGLLVFPMVGCSDVSGGGGTGGAAATGGAAGQGGASDGTGGSGGEASIVTEFIQTVGIAEDGTTAFPLPGVTICQLDTDNCVVSDENGRAALDLPANQEVARTVEKEGYGAFLTHDVTDETWGGTSTEPMHTDEQLAEYAAQLGIMYPWTGGIVGLATAPVVAQVAGVTFELLDEPATTPFYFEGPGVYSYDLEATPGASAWPAPFGMGGFAELSPGEYQFEFHGVGDNCRGLSFGWPGDGPNRIRIPIREGYISCGGRRCE